MLATILITNYNYADYLPAAIESALEQDHPDVEIVVVDDGSTDGSRDVIESYADRITPVFRERNEGQAAAFNAGFPECRGEIVCLLDSDDLFSPSKVSRVIEAYRSGDSVVFHQLERVRDDLTPDGKPAPRSLLSGDIRDRVRSAGGWWPKPSTTGLSFPRAYLERVAPVPVMTEHVYIDTYLAGVAPFCGPVRGVEAVLGYHRIHGSNTWSVAEVASKGTSVSASRHERAVHELAVLQETLGRIGVADDLRAKDHIRIRQLAWLAGAGGSAAGVIATTLRCPTLPWSMKWREVVRILLRRW